MLISTEALQARLLDSDTIVFDCRHDLMDPAVGRRLYAEGHLPGARFASVDDDLAARPDGTNGRHPLPSPEDFASFLRAAGVRESSRLVAYDAAGGQYAARFWWMCRWVGVKDVVVLDGGWPKWLREGRPVSNEVPETSPGDFVAQVEDGLWVSAAELQKGLAEQTQLVVDARAPARYRGETEPIDPVAGHIPGAVNFFYQDNLESDGTFKPPGAIAAAFKAVLGDRDPAAVVHQCGSGITACANLLALEYAGFRDAKLYPGSWSEWIADPSRPVATGA